MGCDEFHRVLDIRCFQVRPALVVEGRRGRATAGNSAKTLRIDAPLDDLYKTRRFE